jgi:hypothetical protein
VAVKASKKREDRLNLIDNLFRKSKGLNEGVEKVNMLINTSLESISRNVGNADDQLATKRNYTLQSHRRNLTIISNR